jgi:hypothetical protein
MTEKATKQVRIYPKEFGVLPRRAVEQKESKNFCSRFGLLAKSLIGLVAVVAGRGLEPPTYGL